MLLAVATLACAVSGCGGSAMAMAPEKSADGAVATGGMAAPMASPAPQMEADESVNNDADGVGPVTRDARVAALPPGGTAGAPPAAPPTAPPGTDTQKPPDNPTATDAGTETRIAAPLLIYTATLNMAVFETQKAIDRTEKVAREMGGYLVRRSDRSITVRVPAKEFHGLLEALAKDGDELHREVTVQDVTEQFYDLQVRLKNAQAVRDRVAKLLEAAKDVTQALAVERELERIAGDVERYQGKLKLFRELIAFSTITVNYEARATDQLQSTVHLPFPWLDQLGLSYLLSL